jgi:dephospho-CoA kinase
VAGQPPLIGVTGAVGVGKSTVLQAFALRGCACLSADAVVHTLYHQAQVRDAVVARFGAEVLDETGEVDRRALGRLAFADPDSHAWLEDLIHPLVGAHMRQWLAEAQLRDPAPPLVVYESPLLLEVGLADVFDRVLLITADDGTRRERLAQRGALARLEEREARMWPLDRRRAAADDEIANDGSADELQHRVDAYIARYAGA